MNTYKILSTGNRIISDQLFVEQNYPNNWELIEVLTPSIQLQPQTLTKLQYMERFTDQELAAIYTAAKTNIQVEIWLEKFKATTEINTADLRISVGLQALETAGLLAAGRAQEIISWQ